MGTRSGEYTGVHYDVAINKLGKPDIEDEFIYSKSVDLYEYQGNLYQLLGDEDGVKVVELRWKGWYDTTIIWFVQHEEGLVAIDSLRYGKYVSF